jgi:hypothetical protein
MIFAMPAFAKKGRYGRVKVQTELQEDVQKACGFGVRFDYSKAWTSDPDNLNDGKAAIGKFVVRFIEKACAEDRAKVQSKLRTVSFLTKEGGSIAATLASGTFALTVPDTDADGMIIKWGWSDKEKFDPVIRDALRKGLGLKLPTEEEENETKKAKERAELDKQKKADAARDAKNQQDQAAREQKAAQITNDFQADVARIQKEKANDPNGMAKALEAAQLKMQKRMQELEKTN